MDNRYRNPQVTGLWDLPWTYDAWWRIERAIVRAQLKTGVITNPEARALLNTELQPEFHRSGGVVAEITCLEDITQHDVAAFVEWLRQWWGEPHARWIHFGVTSSDLVDTAQGLRFRAMGPVLRSQFSALLLALREWEHNDTVVLGRTHGQPAEPTAIMVRAAHWTSLVLPAVRQLVADSHNMEVAKVSGPVGTFAHNPPEVEAAVAKELGLAPVEIGASQIAPRGNLGRWANSAAEVVQACAKIAMDLRLMNLLGESGEPKAAGQVGSSAMAHKNNPIRAEQVTGLARLAAGYASMLQPLDLWLERDISHSCVERVAVPDLWHVLLRAMKQTTALLTKTELRLGVIEENLAFHSNAAWTSKVTVDAIRDGMDADQAREYALDFDTESYDPVGKARQDHLSNYPWKPGQ